MARIQNQFSFIEFLCLLPNEWKDHPEAVTRMILVQEFKDHLLSHKTIEGLVIEIADVTAESRGHCNLVWFRKHDGDDVEPDMVKYYPMKIRIQNLSNLGLERRLSSGKRFAMIQMKSCLSQVVPRVRVFPVTPRAGPFAANPRSALTLHPYDSRVRISLIQTDN